MSDASSKPDRYAVMGHPIEHSWSPFIHGMFARQTGQNLTYRLMDVPPEKFRAAALEFFTGGGRGLNITVPHKPAAAEFVNRLTARAETAGAVNTILVEPNGELMGDNTDGIGLITDLTANLGLKIAGLRILILGAGGATRGVLGPLLDARPATLTIANRTPERAAELVEEFAKPGTLSGCAFDAISEEEPWDLIVNATSASLKGTIPDISASLITAETLCYDMAYGKGDTSFTGWAREQGATRTVKGWGMLVEQAAESFHLWRGIRPDTKLVLAALQAT
ncbi:MAG TPA: shikimate dehydrogenase [Steroidobacteraceae bacterium]|nr:shikimate dehydrogenase [Steroidobacteraceae bacterium]